VVFRKTRARNHYRENVKARRDGKAERRISKIPSKKLRYLDPDNSGMKRRLRPLNIIVEAIRPRWLCRNRLSKKRNACFARVILSMAFAARLAPTLRNKSHSQLYKPQNYRAALAAQSYKGVRS
jgi:hypothetical protein